MGDASRAGGSYLPSLKGGREPNESVRRAQEEVERRERHRRKVQESSLSSLDKHSSEYLAQAMRRPAAALVSKTPVVLGFKKTNKTAGGRVATDEELERQKSAARESQQR